MAEKVVYIYIYNKRFIIQEMWPSQPFFCCVRASISCDVQVIKYSSPTSAGAECIDPDCSWVEQWWALIFFFYPFFGFYEYKFFINSIKGHPDTYLSHALTS